MKLTKKQFRKSLCTCSVFLLIAVSGCQNQAIENNSPNSDISPDYKTWTNPYLEISFENSDFLDAPEEFNHTAQEIVNDMGIGINLGNTFEACGDWINKNGGVTPYETAWGSPVITEEMIKGYADAGFKTLRVPVAWSNLMKDDKNYTISSVYLARVKQIVDWGIKHNLYVIINEHWDGGWIENAKDETKKPDAITKYGKIWEQVSEAFKDYGVKLIFESQNEELGSFGLYGDWDSDKGSAAWEAKRKQSYDLTNEINQTFTNIVRKSGGNNKYRLLYISGYNTGIEKTCDILFKMPQDPVNRQAVSVHYYEPSLYAILEADADWGKVSATWGTEAEKAELKNKVNLMKTTFTDKGIPVIIGEYGCPRTYVYKIDDSNKDNKYKKHKQDTDLFLSSVCEEFYKAGMCP
ncbi:MAG: glycoside hydrolase family 5 protein, partial [Treponema sp.]|nr:glycoside hydrolase family 5 protein [Treponema sp.]